MVPCVNFDYEGFDVAEGIIVPYYLLIQQLKVHYSTNLIELSMRRRKLIFAFKYKSDVVLVSGMFSSFQI